MTPRREGELLTHLRAVCSRLPRPRAPRTHTHRHRHHPCPCPAAPEAAPSTATAAAAAGGAEAVLTQDQIRSLTATLSQGTDVVDAAVFADLCNSAGVPAQTAADVLG